MRTACLLTLLAAAALPAIARADAADDALRLVPPDTAICVVVRDLRTHGRAVAGSPFAKWVQQSPLVKQVADPEDLKKVHAFVGFLSEQIGATPEQFLDDVLGDAVVFAYQPGPPGKPAEEAGVVLVRPRKPEVLARVVGKLNELQQKSGEVKAVREKAHKSRPYFEREKTAGGSEFYLLRDGLFAYSGQEGAIRRVIEQELTASASRSGRVAESLRSLGVADKLAVCWFNPRGFDAELKAKTEAAKDNDRAFLTQFSKVWAAADGVALYAHPGTGIEVGIVAHADPGKLPKELREVLFTPAGPAGVAIPADAMIAATGRLSVPKLLDAIGSFLPPAEREKLLAGITDGLGPLVGRDRLPGVLAGLGPDWAVWLSPPAKGTWVPDWTAAVRVADGDTAKAVAQAVDAVAQLVRVEHNRKHADPIDLGEESRNGVTVKTLTSKAFPPEFRPAYAVRDGYLVLAGSPDAVWRFKSATADGPVVRISAAAVREYLREHKQIVAEAVAKGSNRPVADVAKEFGDLAAGLEAFDRIEVTHTAADGRVTIAVRVEFVKPLK